MQGPRGIQSCLSRHTPRLFTPAFLVNINLLLRQRPLNPVGAHLINSSRGKNVEVFYWLERNQEVDFVLRAGANITAIEVKSGHKKERLLGM